MRRTSRRSRYAALALELAGVGGACYAVSWWSIPLAILLGCCTVIAAAQYWEQLV